MEERKEMVRSSPNYIISMVYDPKEKRHIFSFHRVNLMKIQVIPLVGVPISLWLTVPPRPHEVRSVVLKGKVGMDGKPMSTTPRLGHY